MLQVNKFDYIILIIKSSRVIQILYYSVATLPNFTLS
jgi:hypothetical protein